jgi:hypothetical protein
MMQRGLQHKIRCEIFKNREVIDLEGQEGESSCGLWANIWEFENVADAAKQLVALTT